MQGLQDSSLNAYIDLFKRLASAHVQINGAFCFGDEVDLKLWAKKPDSTYPMLFLEMPEEGFTGRTVYSDYDGAFAIFCRIGALDEGDEAFGERPLSDAWALSQDIARDFLSMLHQMAKKDELDFDITTAKILPVGYSPNADRCVGYRASFKIATKASICVDQSKWL